MTDYRRAKGEGGLYFFTVVTHQRKVLFGDPLARKCLRHAFQDTRAREPFSIVALCLLPDHIHCLWELPAGDNKYSSRWSRIKALFTRQYLSEGGIEAHASASRQVKRERSIWQRRFWEHQIRDEIDLQNHVDYIHFNPVKHHLVEQIEDWPWSSYHRYAKEGRYQNQHCDKIQNHLDDLSIAE